MSWSIDPARTRIGFSLKHMLVSTVRGEFKRYQGRLQIDSDDFTRSTFAGEINVDSLDTGNAERDALLRSHSILGDVQHPQLTFQSTSVSRGSQSREYKVQGSLAVRGVTHPVQLDVAYTGLTEGADGKKVARLRVRGALSRKAYGISFGVFEAGGLSVSDSVNIELDVHAVSDTVPPHVS